MEIGDICYSYTMGTWDISECPGGIARGLGRFVRIYPVVTIV